MSSDDGIKWTATSQEAAFMVAFASGGGAAVAVGRQGVILTSVDGTHWTKTSLGLPVSIGLQGVAYGNGVFAAGGHEGLMYYSTDGTNWFSRPRTFRNEINDVAFGDGLFIATGNPSVYDGAKGIFLSRDGVNWSGPHVERTDPGFGVGYGDGRWLLSHNRILTTASGNPDGEAVSLRYGSSGLEIFGPFGSTVQIESTGDLGVNEDWEEDGDIAIGAGGTVKVLPPDEVQRFYRVRVE